MHQKLNLKIIHELPTALAVSGGPDSMAMLYMMHELNIQFTVLTVNHNLRPDALEEAEYVSSVCQKLGVPHVILEWQHDGVTSNVHDRARNARYGLMVDWCHKNNIKTLCTAHHMDDRMEHLFIRLYRGAGLLGLVDNEKMMYDGINITRPMFAFTKKELIDYLHEHQIKYCEDKSNSDPKYLRTNIRKWLDAMPPELELDLFRKRVISVKENLYRASRVINRIFEEEMQKVVVEEVCGTISRSSRNLHSKYTGPSFYNFLDPGYFSKKNYEMTKSTFDLRITIPSLPQDKEIAIMMLSHILPQVSRQKDPPRMESMKRLYDRLVINNTSKTTLCGCIIEKRKGSIIISKENGR
jgi:tRNA(Ile)-lysidine synthetase-like protein